MKVFFEHSIFTKQILGGPSKYILDLAKNLNKKNIDARVFAPFHVNDFLESVKKENKFIFGKKVFLNEFIVNKNRPTLILEKLNFFLNKKNFENFNPDILHSTYYNYDLYNRKVKLVVTVYDLIHEKLYKEYGLSRPRFSKEKILNIANQIICISESTKRDLLDIYNIDEKKVHVIHLGINKEDYFLDEKFNKRKPFVLYVGSRQRYKNFKLVIKMISKYPEINKDFDFVFFSSEKFGKYEKEILDYYKVNNQNLYFVGGDAQQLSKYFNSANFLLYPSMYEGFGLPILEAFLHNCPVICSNISSLPEVAGSAAEYFIPDSIDSMANAIFKVINSNERTLELKKLGKERLQNFSLEKCAKETINVYHL